MDAIFGLNSISGLSLSYKVTGIYFMQHMSDSSNYNIDSLAFENMPEIESADVFAIVINGGTIGSSYRWIKPSVNMFSASWIRSEIQSQNNKRYYVYASANWVYSNGIVDGTENVMYIHTGDPYYGASITFNSSQSVYDLSASLLFLNF